MIPGGGWLLLAALAVPIVLRGAKPIVRSVGRGLKKVGETLIDEGTEKEEVASTVTSGGEEAKTPPKPRTRKPAAATKPKAKAATRAKKPKEDAP